MNDLEGLAARKWGTKHITIDSQGNQGKSRGKAAGMEVQTLLSCFSLINPLIDLFSECLQLAAFRAMGSTDGSAAAFLVRSRWQTSGFQFGTCMYE
jgi:hypothetical protein